LRSGSRRRRCGPRRRSDGPSADRRPVGVDAPVVRPGREDLRSVPRHWCHP
jgi:hypothetical protein